jgi:hypothetical protein
MKFSESKGKVSEGGGHLLFGSLSRLRSGNPWTWIRGRRNAAIDFTARLRGTVRFDSIDDLITQMHDDVDRARELCRDV